MNLELVEKIAEAVLYEGYMLYPYRPSAVKNQRRFNFGVLVPPVVGTSARGPCWWGRRDFDLKAAHHSIQSVRPGMQVLEVSAKTGQGMDEWLEFIQSVDRKIRKENHFPFSI